MTKMPEPVDEGQKALELQSRDRLYKAIEENPGLHFRELQRRSGMAVGSLQYHLQVLERHHLVRIEKTGKFSRFYSVRGPQLGDKQVLMSFLRKPTVRRIVLFLIEKKRAANDQISKKCELSPSTVSWHMNELLSKGIVGKRKRGRKIAYFISDPVGTAELLKGYRESFVDELVDNFVQVWDNV